MQTSLCMYPLGTEKPPLDLYFCWLVRLLYFCTVNSTKVQVHWGQLAADDNLTFNQILMRLAQYALQLQVAFIYTGETSEVLML